MPPFALPLFADQPPEHWLDAALGALASHFPPGTFLSEFWNLRALVALVLVSLICGSVGALVVGGRMAFFSDALAHCAFAGVSIGVLFTYVLLGVRSPPEFWAWVTPIMIAFGMTIGVCIAYVREKTGLASDTVIGVAFAAAIGLAAMLRKALNIRELFALEDFLFGDPLLIRGQDVVYTGVLLLVTAAVLGLIFNSLLLAGFSHSLALSRRVPTRAVNYLFIMLLAAAVNLCARNVGVLLINALLIVPAATASNCARNLRVVFWLTVGLCLFASVSGLVIASEASRLYPRLALGTPGTVILVSVALFLLSMLFGPRLKAQRQPAAG